MGNVNGATVSITDEDLSKMESEEIAPLTNSDLEDIDNGSVETPIPSWVVTFVNGAFMEKAESDGSISVQFVAIDEIDPDDLQVALNSEMKVRLNSLEKMSPYKVAANDVNQWNRSAGSASALEAQMEVIKTIMKEVPEKNKKQMALLSLTQIKLGTMGYANKVLVIGSNACDTYLKDAGITLKSKPEHVFAKTSLARKLSPAMAADVDFCISTEITVAWTRIHAAGGYARGKDQASKLPKDSARVKAANKAQKHTDTIVQRAVEAKGLKPDGSGIEAYYVLSKSHNRVAMMAHQMALECLKQGGARSSQDPLRASLEKYNAAMVDKSSNDVQVHFVRSIEIPAESRDSMGRTLRLLGEDKTTSSTVVFPCVITPMALSCKPRRDGGGATFRTTMRALTRWFELLANGGAFIGGLQVDGAMLIKSLSPMVRRPHLFHPAYNAVLPSMQDLGLRMTSVANRAAAGRINAAYAACQEGRSGEPCRVSKLIFATDGTAYEQLWRDLMR